MFGWYGVTVIVMMYLFAALNILPSSSWISLLLNCTGSLGIVLVSYSKKDLQPVALNVVWLGIALVGLLKALL